MKDVNVELTQKNMKVMSIYGNFGEENLKKTLTKTKDLRNKLDIKVRKANSFLN